MREFAYIGRDTPSKGLPYLIDIFNQLHLRDIRLHVFSDYNLATTPNIICHGWVPSEEIWNIEFHYIILPTLAPETYCFSLHDAVKHNKGVIVNRSNASLCSQISEGAYTYETKNSLYNIVKELSKENNEIIIPKLVNKATLWKKLYGDNNLTNLYNII